jgi:hypothetical protein
VLVEPPVQPDAATARRWAATELADPVYHRQESLLIRLVRWILEQFDGLPALGVSPRVAALVVVGVLAVVVALALWIAGPVRRARRVAARAVLARDDRRTAAQLRTAADAAAAGGDWSLAVAERFRAVVRDLEERAVLDERPGRTALEVADEAGRVLPAVAADLAGAAEAFDDVVYGERPAGPEQDAAMRATDQRVRAARRVALVPAVAP